MKGWNFHRLLGIIIYVKYLHFSNHSWKNDWTKLEKIQTFTFFSDLSYHISPFPNRWRWKAETFTDCAYRGNIFINCTSIIIVGKMTVQSWKMFAFLTFYKGAHHILTFRGGKLKFSQNMQVKEMFSKFLIPKS